MYTLEIAIIWNVMEKSLVEMYKDNDISWDIDENS